MADEDVAAQLIGLVQSVGEGNVNAVSASGSAQTLPASYQPPGSATAGSSIDAVTLTAACTITLPLPSKPGEVKTVVLVQDGTGGRVVTWAETSPATLTWVGAAPVLQTAANKIDVVKLVSLDGVNWVGIGTSIVGTSKATITGALSTVTDAAAKAVLTSIISGLVALGLATNSTT